MIPNGVDVEAYEGVQGVSLDPWGIPRGRRAITCVCRLTPQKGVDLLVQMAPRFLAALPQHDLLIVGDGPEAARLQRQSADLELASRVHFCGWQPQVSEILRASDLLVLPSRWEGMPNVVLEAMACARPVVCMEAEGVLEILGPLAAPQSAPIGDAEVFISKVVKILSQPELAASLGRNNFQRVAENFSLRVMLRKYEALFTEVVGGLAPARNAL